MGASPLRHSARRCATSPAGGGKRTCVSFGKVCGKAKLKKLRLTTKFSFAHGRTLGSPSGRAGETPARAARLRGEPPTRAGEVPPQAAERARTERRAKRRNDGKSINIQNFPIPRPKFDPAFPEQNGASGSKIKKIKQKPKICKSGLDTGGGML